MVRGSYILIGTKKFQQWGHPNIFDQAILILTRFVCMFFFIFSVLYLFSPKKIISEKEFSEEQPNAKELLILSNIKAVL